MRCLLVAVLLVATTACAASPRATATPAPLATTVVRYSPPVGIRVTRLAILPVISDPGLEGLRGMAADSLYAAIQEARPRFYVLSAREALATLERSGLAERYWEMIADYNRSGTLDTTLLGEIGAELGVPHLLQMKVAHAERADPSATPVSGRGDLRLYTHLWDAGSGEIVWEAVSGRAEGSGDRSADRSTLLTAMTTDLAATLPVSTTQTRTSSFGRLDPGGSSAEDPQIRITPWVASQSGRYYYWYDCDTARGLPEDQRVYFETEEDARTSGLRLSPVPQCQGPPGIR